MTNQEDQNEFDFPFPYEIYDADGKLVIKHIESGMVGELDFDITKTKNLTKNEKKLIKNKKESDTILKKKKIEDLEEDAKTEVKDGQKVKVEAEGDDDDVEGKIKGDPYQDGDKKKGEKFVKSKDFEAIMERLAVLESREDMYQKLALKQEDNDAKDMEDLKEILSQVPYEVPLEIMNDMSLEALVTQKAFMDNLPHVKDFVLDEEPISFRDIDKGSIEIDMNNDPRSLILKDAQARFVSDFGGVKK